jgi:hypothetical protein
MGLQRPPRLHWGRVLLLLTGGMFGAFRMLQDCALVMVPHEVPQG